MQTQSDFIKRCTHDSLAAGAGESVLVRGIRCLRCGNMFRTASEVINDRRRVRELSALAIERLDDLLTGESRAM